MESSPGFGEDIPVPVRLNTASCLSDRWPTARGNVSTEPTNPQQTLENSVQVKNTSTARVGVDPSTGEHVMFHETASSVYHGYAVKDFNDLPNEAKAALQNVGMVSWKIQ